MVIRGMHYHFKLRYNKVDSQSNRNFLVPEIDMLLNDAANLFVSIIAEPRIKRQLGFEVNQRTIDDIANIVVSPENTFTAVTNNVSALPANYFHMVKGIVKASKGKCIDKLGRLHIVQHDDLTEETSMYKSSFEWREFNAHRFDGGIRFLTDGSFIVNAVCLSYIRKMVYMHNAQDYLGGTYISPEGVTLTGSVNCELPETTHSDIIDIAVFLASTSTQTSNYQQLLNKLNFNQIT